MGKWMRACCLSAKEALDCDRALTRQRSLQRRQGESQSQSHLARAASGGGGDDSQMKQSDFGFVESLNTKITLTIRPPPSRDAPHGTVMPYEVSE